ncbi:MAG: hypothetical protein GC171_15235 [Terrimonas sp.]|nr:hypothetical protein [Terrimonas sp.]
MKKLLDLRFVIGGFFTLVGIFLSVYYILGPKDTTVNTQVNIWCGLLFLLFGIGMVILSYVSKINEE